MASRFNTLLHGSAEDAAAVLGEGVDLDSTALRAALTNALYRIEALESKARDAEARQPND